jgi:hypothetical protein
MTAATLSGAHARLTLTATLAASLTCTRAKTLTRPLTLAWPRPATRPETLTCLCLAGGRGSDLRLPGCLIARLNPTLSHRPARCEHHRDNCRSDPDESFRHVHTLSDRDSGVRRNIPVPQVQRVRQVLRVLRVLRVRQVGQAILLFDEWGKALEQAQDGHATSFCQH